MQNYTVTELASNRGLWEEYIDTGNYAPFDETTQDDREEMILDMWPDDFDADGNPIETEENA